MKQKKVKQSGFEEKLEQRPLEDQPKKMPPLQTSKLFEAALQAVEDMNKPIKH